MWQGILTVYQLRVVSVWPKGTSRFKTLFSRRDNSSLFAQRSRLLKFFASSYDCSIWWKRALHREYKFKDCLYSVYFENVIDMRRFIIGLKQTWIAETGGVLNWQCNYIGKVHPNVLGREHKLLRIWYDVNCMAFIEFEFTCIYDYFPYWIYYCYCLQFSLVSSATADETGRENNMIVIFQKHPFTEEKKCLPENIF